jgi:hypothetical protein
MATFNTEAKQLEKYKPVMNESNKDSFSIDGYLKVGQRHDLLELSGNSADARYLDTVKDLKLLHPEMYLQVLHLRIDNEDRYLYLSPLESFMQFYGGLDEDQEIKRRIISRGSAEGYSRGYTLELDITVNIRTAQVQINGYADCLGVDVLGFRLKTSNSVHVF